MNYSFRSNFTYEGELVPIFIAHDSAAVTYLSSFESIFVIHNLQRVVQKFHGQNVQFPNEVVIPDSSTTVSGLCFRSLSSSPFSVTISDVAETAPAGITNVCYSLDEGSSWVPISLDDTVSVPAGSSVLFKADTWAPNPVNDDVEFQFSVTDISVEGPITSLTGGSTILPTNTCFAYLFYGEGIRDASGLILPSNTLPYCYLGMFCGNSLLQVGPALPALTLSEACYDQMFDACVSLIVAPALPATTLAGACYQDMFQHCDSLTEAPVLPAITLEPYCYAQMFANCGNLSSITVYATDFSPLNCTRDWVENVAATGTFRVPATAVITSDISGIPSGWTRVDL